MHSIFHVSLKYLHIHQEKLFVPQETDQKDQHLHVSQYPVTVNFSTLQIIYIYV